MNLNNLRKCEEEFALSIKNRARAFLARENGEMVFDSSSDIQQILRHCKREDRIVLVQTETPGIYRLVEDEE